MNSIEIQNGINHIFKNDKYLAKIIEKSEPCSIAPKRNYYDMLLRAIIQQQLSIYSAASIHRKFLEYYGNNPIPENILNTPHETLRSIGLSNAKAKYIKDLSEKLLAGVINFKGLGKKSDEEIIELLVKVKGIGVWTVHMFLIFTLGRLNVLPVGDLGLKRAIMNGYGLRKMPDERRIVKISKENSWYPYNSIASWYLWKSLEL
jgi:DNA-3-methyladenine glycosylase II